MKLPKELRLFYVEITNTKDNAFGGKALNINCVKVNNTNEIPDVIEKYNNGIKSKQIAYGDNYNPDNNYTPIEHQLMGYLDYLVNGEASKNIIDQFSNVVKFIGELK